MNAEVIEIVNAGLKVLPLKSKIAIGLLAVAGYVGINLTCAVKASNNGQGFENKILGIKIYPKGQDVPPVTAQGTVV